MPTDHRHLAETAFTQTTRRARSPTVVCTWAWIWAQAVLAVLPGTALSSSLPDGAELMQAVADRDRGETRIAEMKLFLTNSRDNTREQETITYRKYYGAERRSVIFYREPSNVRGTAFLTYDYADADTDDDQWLYLPATRKVRRISASSRGDYFLGTDFTYGDIKNENRLPMDDYEFAGLERDQYAGVDCVVIEAVPVTEQVSEELGYSRVRAWVDRPSRRLIRDSVQTDLTLLVQRDFLYDTLTAEIIGIHNTNLHDGLVRPELRWEARSNLEISLGADIFHGDSNGRYGQFDRLDRGVLAVELGL